MALSPLGKEEDLDREVRNQIDLVHGTVDVKVGSDEIQFNADKLPPIENPQESLIQGQVVLGKLVHPVSS